MGQTIKCMNTWRTMNKSTDDKLLHTQHLPDEYDSQRAENTS